MADNGSLAARVLEYMTDFGMLPPAGGGVLCALSGGADSMCLLSILRELLPPLDIRLAAAHYNHHLRGGESDRDEKFVREYCLTNSVRLFTGGRDVRALAEQNGFGIEEAAREARYAFLREIAAESGFSKIATAHNAGDNLETMLFNLARGSGLRGVSGIPPVRGTLVRPLLTVTREEIEACLREHGVPFVVDSSNLSDDYSRNKIRHAALPALMEINSAAAVNAARAARLMREDEEYLSACAREFVAANARDGALPAAALAALPRPVASRAVRIMSGPRELSEAHVNSVLGLASAGAPSVSVSLPGMKVRREYDNIVFGGAQAGIIPCRELSPGDNFELYPGGPSISFKNVRISADINSSLNIFHFKPDSICGKMFVRPRMPGDCIRVQGRGVTKTLHKLFIEAKIPRERRALIPVLCDGGGVIAVAGFGASERAAAAPGESAIEIEIIHGRGSGNHHE